MAALHVDWIGGVPAPGMRIGPEEVRGMDLRPNAVTAALVGLENRTAVFSVQRRINTFDEEPLMAILPGVALDELWEVVGIGEKGLLLMSGLVALVSMAGLMSVVLAGLDQRRRELAVLRAVGASPLHLLALLAMEGLIVTVVGIAMGIIALLAAVSAFAPWLQAEFGLAVHFAPTSTQWILLAGLLLAGWVASLLPGWRAYRLA